MDVLQLIGNNSKVPYLLALIIIYYICKFKK